MDKNGVSLSLGPPFLSERSQHFHGVPPWFREEQATKLEPGGFPPWPLRITRNSWQRPWKESRWWEPRLELSQVVSSWGVDFSCQQFSGIYPLVNIYEKLWKITMLFMGKSTMSTGPFSIAFCMFTRG